MTATSDEELETRAHRVYRGAVVIDMHNDLPSKIVDHAYDPAVRHPSGFVAPESGHTDLPRLIESGITATFFAAFVDAPYARAESGASFARALRLIQATHGFVANHPERLLAATRAADVRRAKDEDRIAAFIAVEGGHAIESSLERLRDLFALGARYMTLTWNNGTEWAGAALGAGGTRTAGLTAFGREVVREMNRLGMLVDVSHASEETLADAIDASSDPVIASHSSARALCDNARNLSDAQLRLVADCGGVTNVNFCAEFLDVVSPVPFRRLVDHIEHIVRVAGVDHVGIGSDFDGVALLPEGMADVTALPRLASELLRRGYADDEVGRILGGNMLRVMEQVLDRVPR